VRFPLCSCGKCTCAIGEKLIKMVDDEKAHQFLVGLNDKLDSNIRG